MIIKMKTILIAAIALLTITINAAEKETAKWIDSISIAPVGVIKTENIDGASQYGAGLDLGVAVNPFVSVHVVGLSFEGAGTHRETIKTKEGDSTVTTGEDRWSGRLIDELDIQIDSKIARFSNESFSLHVRGGGQYDFNDENYGVNVGLLLQLDLSRNFAVAGGYDIRTWFKGQTKADSLASFKVVGTF